MPDFKRRHYTPELMDDLQAVGPVVHQTLRELRTINTWLGGYSPVLRSLGELAKTPSEKPLRIVDIGCGGGDTLSAVARHCHRRGITVELTGVDANPEIVRYAASQWQERVPARFVAADVFSEEFGKLEFDVACLSLFCHHFDERQLHALFSNLKSQARTGIVVNDLHRAMPAYYGITLLVKLFSRSPMVRNDGPLSVLRAFRRAELERLFAGAGFDDYSIRWQWAWRWRCLLRPPSPEGQT